VPSHRGIALAESGIRFNYTTVLNILFLALAALLVYRFLRTGGPAMLRMMDMPTEPGHHMRANAPNAAAQ
jgi:hypothetical protein